MFKIKEEYAIKNAILDAMKNDLAKIEGSYNYDVAGATAVEISNLYKEVEELQKQLFPWTVTQDFYLDLHMKFFGLTRREKTKATGEVTFSGKPASIVKIGSVVISRVGQRYVTLENCVLDIAGKGTARIEAVEGGEVGNCGIGDINSFELVITGVDSVTNLEQVAGGFEIESLESCKLRMQEKASRPAHSGNKNYYENLAKSVGGVGKVKVIGAGEHGVLPGQVKILITDYNLEPAPSELVENVQNHVNNDNRAVNDDTTVLSFDGYVMNIKFNTLRVKAGTISKSEFLEDFTAKIRTSLLDSSFTFGDIISLAKIGVLALQTDGVIDYDNLTVNNLSNNISLAYNQTPTLGTVEVTNYVEA